MKKILIITISLLLVLSLAACNQTKDLYKESTADKAHKALDKREKFTRYEDLTNRFMEYCQSGNLEGVYSLYYDDLLTKTYQRISDKITKEEFDAGIKAEMETIYSYEEFEYGCDKMPTISSPLSYVNQLIYHTGGETLKLSDSQVSNCVDLRVYRYESAYPSDHMMACIDGYWYFVV